MSESELSVSKKSSAESSFFFPFGSILPDATQRLAMHFSSATRPMRTPFSSMRISPRSAARWRRIGAPTHVTVEVSVGMVESVCSTSSSSGLGARGRFGARVEKLIAFGSDDLSASMMLSCSCARMSPADANCEDTAAQSHVQTLLLSAKHAAQRQAETMRGASPGDAQRCKASLRICS
eukprot:265967-Pleurochrysis_carterae.AAC.2